MASLRVIQAIVIISIVSGLMMSFGYLYRQYECRGDMQVVMVKAPNSDKLYPVAITNCSLPANWGGDKAAIPML